MATPFQYQIPVVDAAITSITETGRALIVMASGTGKTLTSAFTLRRTLQPAEKVLYLCHNSEILNQAVAEYRSVFGDGFRHGFLRGEEKSYSNEPFLFATFQTMREWRDAFDPKEFAFVVVDESHHGQAMTFRQTIEYFHPRGLIGLTATPDREDGLDIRDLFGPERAPLPLEEAIAKQYVTQVVYKLMTMGSLSKAKLKELLRSVREDGKRLSLKQVNETVFIERRDKEIAKAILAHSGRGIVFCESITHAENFGRFLPDAVTCHSKQTKSVQEQTITAFRNGNLRFLLVVDKFNEGIDVPDTELIVFLRCTDSMRIFLQQLGRGLRKALGKKLVTILDFVANVERIEFVARMRDSIREFLPPGTKEKDDTLWHLDGAGIDFTVEEDVVQLLEVLRRIGTPFYETYAEASAASKLLGVKTVDEYRVRFKEDPRLPSGPERIYRSAWISWPHFLRGERVRSFYATLEEASVAAKVLGFKSSEEYSMRYKEDPLLPSDPDKFYSEAWTSWVDFLGKRRGAGSKKGFYRSIEEASEAALKLGISDSTQYRKEHKRDPKLPSNPHTVYAAWISWPEFLKRKVRTFYKFYQEASCAAQKNEIKTRDQYLKEYKKDPGLPSDPSMVYKNDWITWAHFLGTKKNV